MDDRVRAQAEIEALEAFGRGCAAASPADVASAVDRLARLEALYAGLPGGPAELEARSLARLRALFGSPRFDLESRTGFFADTDARPGFGLRGRRAGATLVWELSGSLDVASAPRLEDALEDAVATGDLRLVVDLQGLEYVSSAGLRALLKAAKRLRIALCTANGHVARVLEAGGIARLLPVRPDLESALLALDEP